LIPAQDSNSTT